MDSSAFLAALNSVSVMGTMTGNIIAIMPSVQLREKRRTIVISKLNISIIMSAAMGDVERNHERAEMPNNDPPTRTVSSLNSLKAAAKPVFRLESNT